MTANYFLSSPNFNLHSTPFLEPSSSSLFSSSTKPFFLKTPLSISSNASPFFLQNHSFSPSTTKTHTNLKRVDHDDDENGTNFDDTTLNIKKMPTAPWMTSPLLLPSNEVLDLSKPHKKIKNTTSKFEPHNNNVDKSLTEKISGRKGHKVVTKIAQKIERLKKGSNFDFVDNTQKNLDDTQKNWEDTQKNWGDFRGGFKRGEDGEKKLGRKIAQKSERLKKGSNFIDNTQKNLDDTQKNWGDFRGGFKREEEGEKKLGRKMMPWEREEKMVFRRMKREKVVSLAEMSLDEELLRRLRWEASNMRKWVKVNKIGVSEGVVDEVRSIWVNNELVMLKFDLPLCRNMDRAREIVELKTGGLVVWSKKDSFVAYRGCDYHLKRRSQKTCVGPVGGEHKFGITADDPKLYSNFTSTEQSSEPGNMDREKDSQSSGLLMERNLGIKSTDRSLYEREGDRLLEGLGPRFVDWWYPKPLPVDGDLLPEVVPGFKPPFRLCPPRVRPQLTDDELTYLRNLARPLPVHFVLGRNSKLQGLAVAILKLWEKSVFAKIAVKWGVPNTNNELMASELKRLTGGVLLLRNKFFIVLYRGKDFLPGNLANAVIERDLELRQWQLHEEDARLRAAGILDCNVERSAEKSIVGTFEEFQQIQIIRNEHHIDSESEVKLEAEKERLQKELRNQEHKLAILKIKIEKAEQELWKLNSSWKPSEQEPDQELITQEERECFRKIGLKMGRVLELGRRGVFDGVIEGFHQHWKHKELVKVISLQKTFLQVYYTARTLERESGGILICIEKLKKGHAIIIYRGKNYKRPVDFGENLLDKKKALKRSLEMQRLGSLNFFAHQRGKEIADLKLKLADLEK